MLRRPVSQVLYPAEAKALDAQGYRLIRGALGRTDLDHLRDLFDQATVPSHAWPVPRGGDWRHAQLHATPGEVAADAPLTLEGHAGDILAFDARLLHGATANHSGARRRTLLATYAEAAQLDAYRQTSGLRGVRMTIDQLFVREVA